MHRSESTCLGQKPGRYRGEFAVPGAGRYYVNLSGSAGDVRVGPKTFGLAVPYSSEYLGIGADREHLRDLAAATGGRLLPLTSASLAAVTAADPQAVGRRWRVWWPLFVAALVLLMFEVAVRKVALPESWRLRWQGLRDRPRQTIEDEPEYEELRATIAKVREQHVEALRGRIHYRQDDPGVRARLYLASFKSSRR